MSFKLSEIFDIEELRKICESFTELTGNVTAILDLDGTVHISTGWQTICTQFHRCNIETSKRCTESDTILSKQLKESKKYSIYKCKNGLIDVAMPIIINNTHIGNLFTGQFLLEDPNTEYFVKQAKEYGFDEAEYLLALDKIPVYTDKQIKKTINFLVQLTETIGNIGVRNLKNIEISRQLETEKSNLIEANNDLRDVQEELTISKEKLRSYIVNAPDGIFVVDENGKYIEINEAACNMSGYSEKELLELSIPDLLQDEYLDKAQHHFQRVVNNGFASGELGYLTKSGEKRFWSIDAVKISDSRFLGFSKDITDRKNAEKELLAKNEEYEAINEELLQTNNELIIAKEIALESEQKFKTLFKDNNSVQLLINPDSGYIVDANQAACKFYGYTHEQITALKITDINQYSDERIKQEMLSAKQKNRNYFEFQHKLSDGIIREVEVYSNPIFIDNVKYLISIIHDITARKVAEDELFKAKDKIEESELKYRLLFENSLASITVFDRDYRVTMLNAANAKIIGVSKEEIIGKSIHELFPDVADYHVARFDTIIKEGNAKIYEDAFELPNGTLWFSSYLQPVIGKNNEVEGIQIISTDITEKKQTELELIKAKEKAEENEQLLSKIAENYPNSFLSIIEQDLTVGFTAGQEFQRLDLNPNDFIGLTLKEVFGEYEELVKDYYLRTFNGEETSFELFINNQYQHYKTVPFFNDKKEVIRILSVVENITSRKQKEQELFTAKEEAVESEKKLLVAQELAHVGSWQYYIDDDTVTWSKELYNIFDLSYDLPAPIFSEQRPFYTEESYSALEKAVQDCIKHEKPYEIELEIYTTVGSKKHIISKGNVKKDDNNKIIGAYGTAQDITLQKKLELELIRAKEKAEESDRLKSAFLANMSHEIRTPMNGILGFTDLLLEPNLSGEKRDKYTEIINKSGKRMLNTVNDIIDISKIDAGQVEITHDLVNINDEIGTQYEFFNGEASKKGIELKLINKLPKNSSIVIDKHKLESIVSNLIKNAIKYTDSGSIEIYCNKKGEDLEIKITDTGIGIPKNRIKSIFNRFEQADISDIHAREGSGLGLSISMAYVDILKGHIGVESEEGKGSTFYFTVPWVQAQDKQELIEKKEVISTKKTDNKINILIAEDDNTSFEYLEIMLGSIAKSIIRVVNGKEAIELVKKNADIDLILMDVKMPVMDGYTATKEIRKFNKDVIIIAQTAYALIGDKEKVTEVGCNDYISKPIVGDLLIELINKYL